MRLIVASLLLTVFLVGIAKAQDASGSLANLNAQLAQEKQLRQQIAERLQKKLQPLPPTTPNPPANPPGPVIRGPKPDYPSDDPWADLPRTP